MGVHHSRSDESCDLDVRYVGRVDHIIHVRHPAALLWRRIQDDWNARHVPIDEQRLELVVAHSSTSQTSSQAPEKSVQI